MVLLFWVFQSELHPCILGVGPGPKPCPAHSQRSCAAGCPVAGQGRLSQAEDMATMAAAARLAVQTCGSPEPKGCLFSRPNPVRRCEATFKDLARWRERQQLPGCSARWSLRSPRSWALLDPPGFTTTGKGQMDCSWKVRTTRSRALILGAAKKRKS